MKNKKKKNEKSQWNVFNNWLSNCFFAIKLRVVDNVILIPSHLSAAETKYKQKINMILI